MPFYPDDAPYYGWWGTSHPWYGGHCYPHEHYTEVPANYDKRVALQHKTKEFLNSTVPWLTVKAERDEEFLTQIYYLDLNTGVFKEQVQSAMKPITDKLQDNIDAESRARADADNAQKAEYTKFYNDNKSAIANNNQLIQANTDRITQEQAQRIQSDNELKAKDSDLEKKLAAINAKFPDHSIYSKQVAVITNYTHGTGYNLEFYNLDGSKVTINGVSDTGGDFSFMVDSQVITLKHDGYAQDKLQFENDTNPEKTNNYNAFVNLDHKIIWIKPTVI